MSELARAPAFARRFPYLNVALFLATVVTTLVAGAQQTALQVPSLGGASWLARALAEAGAVAVAGLPFAASLIGILLSHEMGHYLLARAYGVDSTLPFFIPVPVGLVGTFGAVIRIRSAMPTRRAVLDIGAAGPFAGFVVAVPLYAWGIAHSEVRALGDAAFDRPAASLLGVLRDWMAGASHPSFGIIHFGDSLVTLVLKKLFLGPLPPGSDVFEHPVAVAAWVGLLVTTLNLIPLGQLDGGHVTYALLGRARARAFSRLVSYALLASGLFLSWTWLVWWALTRFVVGYDHPPAMLEEPLSPGRRVMALLAMVVFALTFIPVPSW
jgi:membrane-associated protease RseP (regulator of RpoE activity)